MYKPLPSKSVPQTSFINSMTPKGGINNEDFSQVMDINYAIRLINYIPYRFGVKKRGGLKNVFERAGAFPITLLQEFTAGVWIVGYSTKVEAYNLTTGTWTTIKSNFSANEGFGGDRYGEYFFVCNKVDKIWRINSDLTISEIASSPICAGLKAIGSRMYAFELLNDDSAIQYSEVDDGNNPPFDDWTQTTAANTGGTVRFRNAGTCRSVCQLGQYTIGFYDKGYAAFFVNTIDSAGTLKKVEVIQDYIEDYGGARGAIETPQGVYYINEAGLWQMVSAGVTYTPMSRQQLIKSKNLGSDYFKNVDQTSSDIVFDENQKCIFVTVAKNSESNNLIIGYKPEMESFFEFKNWNINRFAKTGDVIYGASSTKTTVYQLFSGNDDDGLSIGTEIYQEIPLKTLFHTHSLDEMYAGGALSENGPITFSFDIYNRHAEFKEGVISLVLEAENSQGTAEEWGVANWGESEWGGGFDTGGMVSCFDGGNARISNFQRLFMKITSGDKLPHILYWVALRTTRKSAIKRRGILLQN